MNYNRRKFLEVIAGGATLLGIQGCKLLTNPTPNIPHRSIMISSDAHIGYEENGYEGSQLLIDAINDLHKAEGNIDFSVFLGDVAHNGTKSEFEKYDFIRKNGSIKEWYEIAGNHDHYHTEPNSGIKNYLSIINNNFAYSVTDGNILWIMLSDEEDSTRGEIGEKTYSWLVDTINKNKTDKNIIICSHQLAYNTVPNKYKNKYDPDDRYIFINGSKATDLKSLEVDIWLCGHEHHFPWTMNNNYSFNGRTTYINVASISYGNNTNESHSFIFKLKNGNDFIQSKMMNHESKTFISELKLPLSYPIELSENNDRIVEIPNV